MAHQQLVEDLRGNDYDLIGIARDGDIGVGVVMKIRRGVLLGRDTIRFSEISECNEAINQYTDKTRSRSIEKKD